MKKYLVMLAVLFVVGIGNTFANTEKEINEKVTRSFKNDFANATDVKWEKTKDLVKVTFSQNQQVMFAYYLEDGSLVAVTRNLPTSQLPLSLLSYKKSYKDYWVTDLFEMVSGVETTYYIALENSDHNLILKSNGTSGWELFKKTKKEVF